MVWGYVIAAAAAAFQYNESRQQRKLQKRAQETEKRRQDVTAARERRQLEAQARRRRAAAQQAAVNSGVAGGSGVAGAVSATQSQLGERVGFQNTQMSFSDQLFNIRQSLADSQGRSALYSAVGNLALQSQQAADSGGLPTGESSGLTGTSQAGSSQMYGASPINFSKPRVY